MCAVFFTFQVDNESLLAHRVRIVRYITQRRQDQTRSEVQVGELAGLLRARAISFRSSVHKGHGITPVKT